MKRLLIALCLWSLPLGAVLVAGPSAAEEQRITPAASEQVMMAERLAALAEARKDPLLMLAALRMRATLDDTAMPVPQGFSSTEELATRARALTEGDDAMAALLADVEAEAGRGWDNAGYCYCFGSSCSCGH